MLLYSELTNPNAVISKTYSLTKAKPSLVFLHGLLGTGEDWQAIIGNLSADYQCICIDLPGHGRSQYIEVNDFTQVQQLIVATLAQYELDNIILVGYSLGARIVMQIACNPIPEWRYLLQGVLLESGNPGLHTTAKQLQRWLHDLNWAIRFSQESFADVLADWYQQGVFVSLTPEQKSALIRTRCQVHTDRLGFEPGTQIGKMLTATSLAKQGDLLPQLQLLPYPLRMICGELDPKFHHLTRDSQLEYQVISQAGHNIHAEQPDVFSQIVRDFINDSTAQKSAA